MFLEEFYEFKVYNQEWNFNGEALLHIQSPVKELNICWFLSIAQINEICLSDIMIIHAYLLLFQVIIYGAPFSFYKIWTNVISLGLTQFYNCTWILIKAVNDILIKIVIIN